MIQGTSCTSASLAPCWARGRPGPSPGTLRSPQAALSPPSQGPSPSKAARRLPGPPCRTSQPHGSCPREHRHVTAERSRITVSQAHERALTRRADEGFAKRSLGLVSCKVANTRPRHRREGCSRFRDAGTEAPRGTVAAGLVQGQRPPRLLAPDSVQALPVDRGAGTLKEQLGPASPLQPCASSGGSSQTRPCTL